jgi:hypothetical protein
MQARQTAEGLELTSNDVLSRFVLAARRLSEKDRPSSNPPADRLPLSRECAVPPSSEASCRYAQTSSVDSHKVQQCEAESLSRTIHGHSVASHCDISWGLCVSAELNCYVRKEGFLSLWYCCSASKWLWRTRIFISLGRYVAGRAHVMALHQASDSGMKEREV